MSIIDILWWIYAIALGACIIAAIAYAMEDN